MMLMMMRRRTMTLTMMMMAGQLMLILLFKADVDAFLHRLSQVQACVHGVDVTSRTQSPSPSQPQRYDMYYTRHLTSKAAQRAREREGTQIRNAKKMKTVNIIFISCFLASLLFLPPPLLFTHVKGVVTFVDFISFAVSLFLKIRMSQLDGWLACEWHKTYYGALTHTHIQTILNTFSIVVCLILVLASAMWEFVCVFDHSFSWEII